MLSTASYILIPPKSSSNCTPVFCLYGFSGGQGTPPMKDDSIFGPRDQRTEFGAIAASVQ